MTFRDQIKSRIEGKLNLVTELNLKLVKARAELEAYQEVLELIKNDEKLSAKQTSGI